MKQRILLLFVMTALITSINAQKKDQKTTGYAITASEKGGRSWKEVRLVDINSGEELKSIYQSTQETEALNARTGKPVVKKENASGTITKTYTTTSPAPAVPAKKVVNLDQELGTSINNNVNVRVNTMVIRYKTESEDKPFSTSSAAMAYDKKHDRLYYTPMGINQLRYIDLNAKSPKLYYFEDESFGVVRGMGDVPNQITRMVIASDGNGYALSNDASHLVRFTTGKKTEITDLGAITDESTGETVSVHGGNMYGGDMIADASKNLYLVTANRHVFKIGIESRTAKYLGSIKGLPQGFSTNGAMVEGGSKVIIASSQSTVGYYRFDLNTLESEKVSGSNDVFNASDLANGILAFDKKKKDKETEEPKDEVKPVVTAENTTAKNTPADEVAAKNNIAVYPNPVTNGVVRLSFDNQPAGRYQVQLLDLSGRLIVAKEVNIINKVQTEELRLPELSVKGNYLIKIFSETNKVSVTNKIVVQ
jgi:Secretion system C-terminal sorting domain